MNILELLLGGVLAMAVGFFWYSPKYGFGKPWMKLVGLTQKSIEASQKDMGKIFGVTYLLNLAMIYILRLFLGGNGDLLSNLITTLFFGVAFTFIPFAINNLFLKRPLKLTLIDAGYHIVVLLGMAAIISLI